MTNQAAAEIVAWALLHKPLEQASSDERLGCLSAAQSIRQLFDAERRGELRRVMKIAGITTDDPKFDDLLAFALWGDAPPTNLQHDPDSNPKHDV